jgi:TonB family protein
MTDRSSSAFFSSILLHAGVIALILILAYSIDSMRPQAPKIFELVAGEGNNFGATAAPALGSADGIKLATPAAPAPPPPAPAVAEAAPAPVPAPVAARVVPAAKPVARPAKPVDQSLEAKLKRAEMRAAVRQEARDKKAAEAEKKKMTEEEFRKEHGPAKPNAVGISGGVVGGSIANKTGGAGGKALTREEASELDTYFSALIARLRETFESTKPTDVSDKLTAKVAFFVAADGTINRVHVLRSSGNAEFDDAAMEAVRHTSSIGPRPDNHGDEISVDFAMHDETAP